MGYVYRRSNLLKVDMRSHHLAVTASNGICAAVLLQNGGCELLVSETASNDTSALKKLLMHPQMPRQVQQVSYACLPQQSTLIPQALMTGVNASGHLELVHGSIGATSLDSLLMDDPAAYCLFQGDRSMEGRLLRHWPSASSIPIQAQCIQSALSRRGTTPLVFVHLWGERLDMVIVDGDGLLLSNDFEVRSAEDLLYFLLFTAEQAGIRQGYDVRYGGPGINENHKVLMERYCASVAPAIQETPTGLKRPWEWVTLLERSLCVS